MMKEIYLREALNQMEELKKRVESIDSLMERALDEKKKWCPHCQLPIRKTKNNLCPRCGVDLIDLPEKKD